MRHRAGRLSHCSGRRRSAWGVVCPRVGRVRGSRRRGIGALIVIFPSYGELLGRPSRGARGRARSGARQDFGVPDPVASPLSALELAARVEQLRAEVDALSECAYALSLDAWSLELGAAAEGRVAELVDAIAAISGNLRASEGPAREAVHVARSLMIPAAEGI